LKVGKAGPKSAPRFTSHHYFCKAPSTLAKSVLAGRDKVIAVLEKELHADFGKLTEDTIGAWIEKHTARLHILMPASAGPHVLSLVEAFVRCKLQPIFEGGRVSSD
jgi:hypothetical protein